MSSLLLLVGGWLAGCDEPGSTGQEAPPTVSVITVRSQPHALIQQLSGRVVARREAEVRPQVSGLIERQAFTDGDDVKAGDLLYTINPDDYQVALSRAQAQLAAAKAALLRSRATAERYAGLIALNSVSRLDHDQAQADFQQAEADVALAQAEVAGAKLALTRTEVRAPIAGRIGRSRVNEGSLVSAQQATPLAVIKQYDPVYVDLVQPSAELIGHRRALGQGHIQGRPQGQPAKVFLDLPDGAAYPLAGRLVFTDISVEPGTATVALRAEFANPEGLLLPGLFVQARLEQALLADAILLPQQAVHLSETGGALTWVVGGDSRVQPRDVELLSSHGDQWVIGDGLAPGEQVVTEGSLRLYPGAQVRALPWQPAAEVAWQARDQSAGGEGTGQ